MDFDATEVAKKILRHPRFKDLVAQSAHGQAPQSQRRARTVYDSPEAELASVWRGRTVTATREKKSVKKTSGKGRPGSSRLGTPAQGTFKKDVVLLLSSQCRSVPTKKRVKLYDDGFIVILFEFDFAWSEEEVKEELYNAFQDKLSGETTR